MWNIWTRSHGFQELMIYNYENSPTNLLIETSNVETGIIEIDEYGSLTTVTDFEEFVYFRFLNKNATSFTIFTDYVDTYIKQVKKNT